VVAIIPHVCGLGHIRLPLRGVLLFHPFKDTKGGVGRAVLRVHGSDVVRFLHPHRDNRIHRLILLRPLDLRVHKSRVKGEKDFEPL